MTSRRSSPSHVRSLYRGLASRRLALALLVALAGVTGVEVMLGLGQRGVRVYGSVWFLGLILLLLASLAACSLQRARKPAARRRERLMLIGSLLFHLGIAGIIVGAGYNELTKWRGRLILGEGQVVRLAERQGAWLNLWSGPWGRLGLDEASLRLTRVQVDYHPDGSLRDFRAEAAFRDRWASWHGEVPVVVRVNHPVYYQGAKFTARDYGFAPRFTLRELSRPVKPPAFDAYVNLDFYAQGPGSEDGFATPDGLVVRARFYPDWRGERGKPLSPLLTPRNPRFWLAVEEGRGREKPLYEGWAGLGEPVRFVRRSSELELSVSDLAYWVQLEASAERGLPLVVAALWASVGGLGLRYAVEVWLKEVV